MTMNTDITQPTDLTSIGRIELEGMYIQRCSELAKLRVQTVTAATAIDDYGWKVLRLQRQVTELQTRGTQLLEDARAANRTAEGLQLALDMHPMAAFLVALMRGRAKYPNGVPRLAIPDEAGEFVHAIVKGEPFEKVRGEALDTAVVAWRWYLGEINREDEARQGITLAGWSCRHCQVFNGEEKELLHSCRSCGKPR